jgi:O-antigen/teichoic acid export membrane protein
MENNYLVTSLIISIIFFIYKFIEMRYIIKENKPIKQFFKETLAVFSCSFIGIYLIDIINTNINKIAPLNAYTGNPEF